jgi:hypothetical protein
VAKLTEDDVIAMSADISHLWFRGNFLLQSRQPETVARLLIGRNQPFMERRWPKMFLGQRSNLIAVSASISSHGLVSLAWRIEVLLDRRDFRATMIGYATFLDCRRQR